MKNNDLPMATVRLNEENGQRQLHSLLSYQPGDVICTFGARETLAYPTYLTVQVGIDNHILLAPEDLQYANHSCAPNIFFDTTTMQVIALQPIRPGDEMTFFYPSTEWDMAQPFQCYCGKKNCLGLIEGAAYLPEEVVKRYKLTDFVLQQLQLQPKPERV
ncbi:MAG TPA: SET domain-containing protein-lysine N-methyltransferase [Saprospiraceae bacterium]|nr:SET domain-containing protein-lysine N-methyltransferase [Saprospiraceae bacterium]